MTNPFEPRTFDPNEMQESPWNRGLWAGVFVAVRGNGSPFPSDLFAESVWLIQKGDVRPPDSDRHQPGNAAFVERVIASGRYDHYTELIAGIALLKDGRFVSWESPVDVAGSGFHEDAYGGNADIFLAATARGALLAISEKTRESLLFATLPTEEAIVNVLYDRYLELRVESSWTQPSVNIVSAALNEPATLQGRMAPDGSDNFGGAAVAGTVDAPLGTCYVKTATAATELWVMTAEGWKPVERVHAEWVTERRVELVRLATESGEFDDLAAPRVDELLRRWDAHYDRQDAIRAGEGRT